jgi:hypothetical protein
MPDFFQTQAQRAQNAYSRGWERETASERVDRQLSTVQRIDTFGSSAAQASKARAMAALRKAREQLQAAEAQEPSAAAVSKAKARREARGQLITAKADLSAAVIELLRATAKPVADALESVTVPIAQRAIDGWPVRTGRSRDAILMAVTGGTSSVTVAMENDAPYIFYIFQGQRLTADERRLKKGQYAWVTLVRKPMTRAPDRIAEEIERRFEVK